MGVLSGGKGHRFDSCRVHHCRAIALKRLAERSESRYLKCRWHR